MNNQKLKLVKQVKVCAIGDGYTGKTCLLCSYTGGKFPEEHIPTVFENDIATTIYSPHKSVSFPVQLSIIDTAGQEDWAALRVLSYPGTDCFLLCYSVVQRDSFENIPTKWVPELKNYMKNDCKFVLVGLKVDLREDPKTLREMREENQTPVTSEEGEKLSKSLENHGCCGFIEVSAKYYKNVKESFNLALDGIFKEQIMKDLKRKQKSICSIM